ncbi:LysR family transcriptional regulator [Wenxinia marina]|uniref:Transcriptional regulator n=1 Tax=Wenxinia marina DSM 24838 TaxID=1123501 RepID=A0A0D0P9F1_9RHOB|nr:LysR family transcriptional regulator [Wenxinia marina]KIQ68171.1 Transcriptional regulator [Wenxinia marina DSM 24838]GGL76468.1 LysR family transcriptional regulator [Wenxinia marina]
MELIWLEDFAELVATRHFSAAAASRNVSQPAFSRRIKALEAWLGAELVDRRTSPVQLTPTGNAFALRCQELVNEIYRIRTECQHNATPASVVINFAAPHTIEMFFFPAWLGELRDSLGPINSHMMGGDHRDCIEALALGNCDFALVWNSPIGPQAARGGPHRTLKVGQDRLVPVSGCRSDGTPIYEFGRDGDALPFLAYSWKDGYLGRLIAMIQARAKPSLRLQTVYQSSLAEGIKQMAIAGMGIGWLPLSCAQGAIEEGRLAQIGPDDMATDMEILLCRRLGQSHQGVEAIWRHLGG